MAGRWRREFAERRDAAPGGLLDRRGCRLLEVALATANVRAFPMAAVEVMEWPAG